MTNDDPTTRLWTKILPGLLTPDQLDQLGEHLIEAVRHGHAEVTIQVKDHKPRFILIVRSTPLPFDGQSPPMIEDISAS